MYTAKQNSGSNKKDFAIVNSLAELQGLSGMRLGATIEQTAYHSDLPFGEPIKRKVEAAAGGMDSVTMADGLFANLYEKVSNVLWFGAKADTVYALSFAAGDMNPGVSSEPAGTDNRDAFQAAVDASVANGNLPVIVPASTNWYKIYAGVANDRSDWLELPAEVSLIGEPGAKIYIHPQEASLNAVGSQGITLRGRNEVSNLIIDGGAQNTNIDTGANEFTLFRTIYLYQAENLDLGINVHNCRFYNACGSHITGDGGGTITACHFGDYLDHCVYFGNDGTGGEGAMAVANCTVYAGKTATVRDAFKQWGAVRMTIANVPMYVPNGSGITVSGRENVAPSDCVISNVSFEGEDKFLDVGVDNATEIIEKLMVSNCTVKCNGHPITVGAISGACPAKSLRFSDLEIECGLPIIVSSGRSDTVAPFSEWDSKVIELAQFDNINMKLTSNTYRNSMILVQGTVKVRAKNCHLSTSNSNGGGGIIYYRYPQAFVPESTDWLIDGCTVDSTVRTLAWIDTPTTAYNPTTFPLDIEIRRSSGSNLTQYVFVNNYVDRYAAGAFDGSTVFIDKISAPQADVSLGLPKGDDGVFENEITLSLENQGILEPHFDARPAQVGEQRFRIRQNTTNGFRDLFIALENDILIRGDSATQFDITDEGSNVFRYTWDGTGTDPIFDDDGLRGLEYGYVVISLVGASAGNNGTFTIVGRGTNYIEVYNASGVAELNIAIGNGGYIVLGFKTARATGTIQERARIIGCSDSQFDITQPSTGVARYTWDTVGTDPKLATVYESLFVGQTINISGTNFNAANQGEFEITNAGTNFFDVVNASLVPENNVTIGTGYIALSPWKKMT